MEMRLPHGPRQEGPAGALELHAPGTGSPGGLGRQAIAHLPGPCSAQGRLSLGAGGTGCMIQTNFRLGDRPESRSLGPLPCLALAPGLLRAISLHLRK